MHQPAGNRCPGCGQITTLVLIGGIQAFCENDVDCHVMSWNPQMSLAELFADMQIVELPDWLGR